MVHLLVLRLIELNSLNIVIEITNITQINAKN